MQKNKKFNIARKIVVLSCLSLMLATVSYAKKDKDMRTPPKEAIEVCVGQEEGFECSMETPRGTLLGKCTNTPDKKYFVCMPEGGPNRR